jgi:hypothetical protein
MPQSGGCGSARRNIIRWTWVTHPDYLARYNAAMTDHANAHLRFIRLRSAAEVAAFLASLR